MKQPIGELCRSIQDVNFCCNCSLPNSPEVQFAIPVEVSKSKIKIDTGGLVQCTN
jgi:hypothetical protein